MGIRIPSLRRMRTRIRVSGTATAKEAGGGMRAALARVRDRPPNVYPLMEVLLAQQKCLPPSVIDRISQTFVSDFSALGALVGVVTRGEASNRGTDGVVARDRLSTAWCATNLITFGPAELGAAICKRADLLKELVTVFEAGENEMDGAVAAFCAKVLQSLATGNARTVAEVMIRPKVIKGCVDNVHNQPASDALVRMVGTRIFPVESSNVAVLPAHRKCVTAMANHRVHRMLAERFRNATRNTEGAEMHAVCDAAAKTMAEISVRASAIRRMTEDPDERTDGSAYMAHLSVIPAHVFNDAREELILAKTPGPLVDVLDRALEKSSVADVIVPALEMVCAVLKSCGDDAAPLDDELVKRVPGMLQVLSTPSGRTLGRTRLALVDTLVAFLERSTSTMKQLVKLGVVDTLLQMLSKFPNHSVLHTRVGQTLTSLLTCGARREIVTCRSDFVQFWVRNKDAAFVALHADALCALWSVFEERKEETDGESVKKCKQEFVEAFGDRIELWRNAQSGLLEETASKQKEHSESEQKEAPSRTLTEDLGHQLYVHAMIEQANANGHITKGKDFAHGLEVCGTALVRAKALVHKHGSIQSVH